MTLRAITLAVLAFALAAPASVSGASASPQTEVKALILKQAQLFKQGHWRAMYATYTPRFRRSCPYPTFLEAQRQTRQLLGTRFTLAGIKVRVETAARAIVAYQFVKGGKIVARVTFTNRDVYTRIGSRWYDELDRVSSC